MKQSIIYIIGIITFFLIETIYYNELFLTLFLITISLIDLKTSKFKEIKLYFLGLILGTIIELYMGKIARSQHWENPLILEIPLWLPLAWGYGFVIIYKLGKWLVK